MVYQLDIKDSIEVFTKVKTRKIALNELSDKESKTPIKLKESNFKTNNLI